MSIRFKVILPYLLLTLLVAATGAYVVTRLVSNTLEERLRNQLVNSGRVVSDTMIRRETEHVRQARLLSNLEGFTEAIFTEENDIIASLSIPYATGEGLENVFVFDRMGQESVHLLKNADGTVSNVTRLGSAPSLSIVKDLLNENNPDSPPKRVIAIDPVDGRYYYFTTLPVVRGQEYAGAVVIGTSLNVLMPYLKSTSSADVILYDANGHAVASTFTSQDDLYQQTISIPAEQYQSILDSKDVVLGNTVKANEREYNIAYGPLKIANDNLGVFAVALSAEFVVLSESVSQRNYMFIYGAAMIAVILIGYFVSRLIITPLYKLVRTSRAIAGGDLTRRTEIKSRDEIGVLAQTFDEMTSHLQQRTLELEKTNKILEQMDRAKMRFIQIAAHELRTPLTLVQGYSQMVQVKAKENNEYINYTNGILEGTSRMVEVIDNMLDVTRIDSNLLEILPADVEIKQVIERVRKTFESALTERRITFTTEGLDALPVMVGDKDLLYKLFYHVIVNAIKYTPDDGRITVCGSVLSHDSKEPQIEVAVKDTGIGIDPQNQELVFEKFYQTGEVLLHSSGKTKFKGGGPGLGLAISRGIVNAHRGRIWLESPGFNETTFPGTTVLIRLPINGRSK